jgi:hypothetical protein
MIMKTFNDAIAQAIGDPGSITPRGDDKTVTRWATRAVAAILATALGVDREGHYPGTPATLALLENAGLRERLRVADDLLHEANGIICSAENLKMTLKCEASHCVEGDHVLDLDNPVPIGDQDWRDAQRRWAERWHGFIRSETGPTAWRGPDEGDIKLPPPPPPPPPTKVVPGNLLMRPRLDDCRYCGGMDGTHVVRRCQGCW